MRTHRISFSFSELALWLIPPFFTAGLLALSFPPLDGPLFAWVALIPLLLQLRREAIVRAFLSGWLCGVAFHMLLLAWTAHTPGINFVVFLTLGLALGLYLGLFAGLSCWFFKKIPGWGWLAVPLLWVSIEYLRSHVGFLSLPFGLLGYSQYTSAVAKIASYTGVYGVSFLILASNCSVAWILIHRCRFEVFRSSTVRNASKFALVVVCLSAVYSASLGEQPAKGAVSTSDQSVNVTIVQGGAGAHENYDFSTYLEKIYPTYEDLTSNTKGSSLIVWPSSSVPGVLPQNREMMQKLGDLAQKANTHLLIGAAGFDKFNPGQRQAKRIANSAFLFSPTGELLNRYDKIRLLPFDEYLPGRSFMSWPDWLVKPGMQDHYPGEHLTVFKMGRANFGVQICFENMFPEQSRLLVRNGADFLIGQTNETYVKSLSGLHQNLAYYVFRAIENNVPLLRSSTTGDSCVIDASGRIVARVEDSSGDEMGITGSVTAHIMLNNEKSFYTQYGDVFAYGCIFMNLLFIAISGSTRAVRKLSWRLLSTGG